MLGYDFILVKLLIVIKHSGDWNASFSAYVTEALPCIISEVLKNKQVIIINLHVRVIESRNKRQ
jgi:hypothetical protein